MKENKPLAKLPPAGKTSGTRPVPPASNVQVTVSVNVTRALPPEFQGHRGQMFGSSFHDNFSNCSVSCIENVIKPLPQKLRGFLNTAINNRVQVLKERETDSCFVKLILLPCISDFFSSINK